MNLQDLIEAARCRTCDGLLFLVVEQEIEDPRFIIVDRPEADWNLCPRCKDYPGIDPEVIHTTGPLRFNTMSIPVGVGAFVFVPVDAA